MLNVAKKWGCTGPHVVRAERGGRERVAIRGWENLKMVNYYYDHDAPHYCKRRYT